ncbi:MAG TPA: acyltransferase family protein [Gemmatimonadaceae bacterium]|nr:acyltransferase family protein [Gemmatimonadaceae bacterium]
MIERFALSPTTVSRTSPRPDLSEKWSRVEAIDMVRGTAMLFVCLAHFSGAYLAPRGISSSELFAIVSMIASPSFMIISGMTAGFLGASHPLALPHLRRRLLDRGLFLLLVGHLLLALSQAERSGGILAACRLSFITDPIAIAIMFGPRMVGRSRATTRVVLALGLLVLGWSLVVLWHPTNGVGWALKSYTVGTVAPDASGLRPVSFPLCEWIAVYLLGTVLGEHVGQLFRSEPDVARRLFLRTGLASSGGGLWLYFSAKELAKFKVMHAGVATSLYLTSPTQKFPPGPAYLLFFGGCGLMLMWLVLYLERHQRFPAILRFLQRFGQASLIVYLVQAFVYGTLIREIVYTRWWPAVFFITLALLGAVAAAWCRIDGNRFLTVGITSLLDRRAQRRKLALYGRAIETVRR